MTKQKPKPVRLRAIFEYDVEHDFEPRNLADEERELHRTLDEWWSSPKHLRVERVKRG